MLVRMAHMTVEHNVNVKGSIIASKPHIILHGLQLTSFDLVKCGCCTKSSYSLIYTYQLNVKQ